MRGKLHGLEKPQFLIKISCGHKSRLGNEFVKKQQNVELREKLQPSCWVTFCHKMKICSDVERT